MIAVIYIASVVSGVTSFYLAGGIRALASDVGVSGAWGLLLFLQFIYATLIFIGFIIFYIVSKKYNVLVPALLPTMIGASIVSISINLIAAYGIGPSIEFIYIALVIIAISAAIFFIATKAYAAAKRRV